MRRLIDDLLSLSRVEDDERLRPTARVNLAEVLASDIAAMAPLVGEKADRISVLAPEGGLEVPGDGDQLIQVFRNLIENALKYGGDGPVEVKIAAVDRFAGVAGPAVRIDVCDHGPGIAPEHLPRLTERFYRVDDHRSRELGGTGLGLAIVKHIVNRHRGRLLVFSDLGQGSTFSVVLPMT
jgi:two-component system phosphate regulon sensor histidine kinase PhoR